MDKKIKFIEEVKVKRVIKTEFESAKFAPATNPIKTSLMNFVRFKKNFKDLS